MSPDELREFVRQSQNRQASTVPVKREADQDDVQTSTTKRGKYGFIGESVDEAIDLTGED
ncbi:hypothetical protein E8E11_003725 [Didymella keratinophila]|nr:hypothetical protein E8E11_003725 [Didymella keratinophila]